MKRTPAQQAHFIAGLEAARRLVERERLFAFKVLGAPNVDWRNGWDACGKSTSIQVGARIDRERAKMKWKR